MKRLLSVLITCPLLLIACVTSNQNFKSVSSSYDGIWEGYAYSAERHSVINMEIKNGIMSGFVEHTKVKGYINADNTLFISPFYFRDIASQTQVIPETNFMSPDRIEGTYIAQAYRFKWFVVKPATAKSDTTISHVKVNEKEPWTGKWKVESASELNGLWAMKQEGKTVKSIKDSDFEFKGKVQGNQLKGKVNFSGTYLPFIIEIPSDGMSFKGLLNYFGGRGYILKGNRIE